MKKIFMTLAAVCFAATMNAQVYVGYRNRLREQQVDWCSGSKQERFRYRSLRTLHIC